MCSGTFKGTIKMGFVFSKISWKWFYQQITWSVLILKCSCNLWMFLGFESSVRGERKESSLFSLHFDDVCVYVFSWMTGEWNPCPVTCGRGLQVRRVECMSHDSSGSRVVEDSQCAAYAPRPLSQQNCNVQKCAQYRVYTWSQVLSAYAMLSGSSCP